ncbi:MAG TPA: FlgD immunoglobulin-like domain containing protein [Gaiella sp.]
MARTVAPAALVAALLVATSAAFVVTEKLKLTRNPIVGPRVDKLFSPVCDCPTDTASITFRLRNPDRVTVEVIDSRGDVVRQLARRSPQGRQAVSYVWDGRDEAGDVVDEGSYRPRVHLDRARRTIVMPNPMRVDVTAPRVVGFTARPLVISPDGDGRSDYARIRYRLSERAVVELYVEGTRAIRKLGTRPRGTMTWTGVAGGEPLPEGVYTLRLVARDVAGNLGPRSGSRTVRIRFLELGRDRVVTVPGARFAILALSQARRLEWRLGGRSGSARPGTLRLRAPLEPGRYTLRVEANGHVRRAAVVVRRTAAP